eukprot:COSAG02_NODE_80_length_40128_cov_591.169002_10_plen_30_part_00
MVSALTKAARAGGTLSAGVQQQRYRRRVG